MSNYDAFAAFGMKSENASITPEMREAPVVRF
jgi:hypothetical protein